MPAAIRFGIQMDVFWELNPKYMYLDQKAYLQEKEEQVRFLDVAAYYQGLYVQMAIASCFSKRGKYPKRPLSMEPKEEPMSGEEKFRLWVMEFNKRFEEDE